MTTTGMPFNIIDEAFVHADDPAEPLTVQIEARSSGALDADRLHSAVGAALDRHPLARGRMEPWVDDATGYQWLIDDEPQVDPFRSMDGVGRDLDEIRASFYSRPLSLFESPPLRVLHVSHDDGDVMMLSIHHSASDGMGALRLLRSICRAYGGIDDPRPDFDPAEARQLAIPTAVPSVADQLHSGQMEYQRLARLDSLPARLDPQGQTTRPGYGFNTLSVAVAPLVNAPLRSETGATVNDLLIAASSLAAGRWIEQHGSAAGRVSVQMPINARPAEWSREVVANLVVGDSVSTTATERLDAEQCLRSIAGWTDAVKQRGPGPALAAIESVPRSGTAARREAAGWFKQGAAPWAETFVLSNLGRVPDDELGAEFTSVFFSPPAPMPLGLGLGAAAFGDRLQLTLRHRWTLWSTEACADFSAILLDDLERLTAD